MTDAKLKPCPFCGSSDVDLWRGQIIGNKPDNGMRFARCQNCGASTSYRAMDEAIGAWNRRDHRCPICATLQIQLDEVSREVGAERMEAADGYHYEAVAQIVRERDHYAKACEEFARRATDSDTQAPATPDTDG